MAGLDPAIHEGHRKKDVDPGSSPGMTSGGSFDLSPKLKHSLNLSETNIGHQWGLPLP